MFTVMAYCTGARVILHFHGGAFPAFYKRQPKALQHIVRLTLRIAARVVVLGAGLRDQFEGLVPPERLRVIPNGVDPAAVLRLSQPGKSGDETQHRIDLLFLGHLSRAKGAVDLLRAVISVGHAYHDPLRLIMAGSPIERERNIVFLKEPHGGPQEIDKLAAHLPSNIELIRPGFVTGEEKKKLLREAHIFVLPSYSEGAPMAVLEAMGAGLPVIATRVGAVPEMVVDCETGFLVAPGAIEQLTDRILVLLKDAGMRERMGVAGRTRINEKYSLDRFVSLIIDLYQDVLRQAARIRARSRS